MSRWQFRVSLFVLFAMSSVVRILIPPNPLYGAGHDDELMVKVAFNLSRGEWLGDYGTEGHLLLAKPPGYSIFLASTYWLPWAPTVSIHILILLGVLLLLRELRSLGASRNFLVCTTAVFVSIPTLFNEQMSRIYREGFLVAITTLVLAFSLMMGRQLLALTKADHFSFYRRDIWNFACCAIGIGILLGFFVISKPSWHLVVLLAIGLPASGIAVTHGSFKKFMTYFLAYMMIAGVVTSAITGSVLIFNDSKFGVRVIDNYSQGQFAAAIKQMYGVEDKNSRPYVTVSSYMRNQMYRVSPTLQKLKPFLEGPPNTGWKAASCSSSLRICDESTVWFPWELRDALQLAGLGKTAKDFEINFGKIKDEIATGCDSGIIRCGRQGLAPGVISIFKMSKRSIIDSYGSALAFLLDSNMGYGERSYSSNPTLPVPKIWHKIVNGLPPAHVSTSYETDDLVLGDLRISIAKLHQYFWVVVVLLGLTTFLFPIRAIRGRSKIKQLMLMQSVMIVGFLLFVGQLSLLQASSGEYLVGGGAIYLLPLLPVLWMAFNLFAIRVKVCRD